MSYNNNALSVFHRKKGTLCRLFNEYYYFSSVKMIIRLDTFNCFNETDRVNWKNKCPKSFFFLRKSKGRHHSGPLFFYSELCRI